MFGEPSLKMAFVKSSATTLAGGMIPTEMVVIKLTSVSGTDCWETSAQQIFQILLED